VLWGSAGADACLGGWQLGEAKSGSELQFNYQQLKARLSDGILDSNEIIFRNFNYGMPLLWLKKLMVFMYCWGP